jgi:hypothetical protein
MIEPNELRKMIKDTLTPLGLWTDEAEELLLATSAQESHLGAYRRQIHGPALGIFQVEPATFHDLTSGFLPRHPRLEQQVVALANGKYTSTEMINNDPFAIAIARVLYWRAPEPLPKATDLEGLWNLYKKRWNTPLGSATKDQFYANYKRFVGGSAV